MLHSEGIKKWIFDEVALVAKTDFQFMETKGPDSLALHCVGNMLVCATAIGSLLLLLLQYRY
jgi:hypothetical protein